MLKPGNNAVIGQSGGPTAAINASLAGAISKLVSENSDNKVFGMSNGIEGLLKEKLYDLKHFFPEGSDGLSLLKTTPGAALGSCRFKLPAPSDDTNGIYRSLLNILKKYQIGYFFYIGGNDSMDTISKISAFAEENSVDLKCIGIPKTIDNDLILTDHTPGFGCAAKYIATVFSELRRDTSVYAQKAVTVVEVMGRDAGWLTAASALSRSAYSDGVDLIYLPEVPFSYDKLFDDIQKVWGRHSDVLIAVSEGIRLENGVYVGADGSTSDIFGHVKLSGAAKVLEEKIRSRFGCKVRSVELNTPQRCASHISSAADISESFDIGAYAVECALNGKTGFMSGIVRDCDSPYKTHFELFDIHSVANKVKGVPADYIDMVNSFVTDKALSYLKPLISGEIYPDYSDGIPKHFIFPKI